MCDVFPFLWHHWTYTIRERIEEKDADTGKITRHVVRVCDRHGCYHRQYYDEAEHKWFAYHCDSFTIPNDIMDWVRTKLKFQVKQGLLEGSSSSFLLRSPVDQSVVCRVTRDAIVTTDHTYRRYRVYEFQFPADKPVVEKEILATFHPERLVEFLRELLTKRDQAASVKVKELVDNWLKKPSCPPP